MVNTSISITWEAEADLVVVGGGVAGLTAARTASLRGLRVLTLSKGGPTDTSTQYAQGGIAVVAPSGDSVESHVHDTVVAGAGLCDADAVRSIVEGGQQAVVALTDLGAVFDLGRDGEVSRTREGGHSTRRIIHAGGDATGAEVQRALNAAGLSAIFGAAVLDIVTGPEGVRGVIALSDKGFGIVHAPAVLLATGGLGQLYACSTNPAGATADGIALALRAGALVSDLEFVQFHPTVLFTPGGLGRRPLISEAVRGEGAILVDSEGDSVTAGVHPRGDLAPRDVVSRAVAARMHALDTDHVYLDARSIDGFAQRFPTITASCLAAGIDPTADLIPVAPAAHFQCGGILTDTHGRTTVPGLYAAGEVARTGLHGANRLASNSLLEGLVVGERAGAASAERQGMSAPITEVGPLRFPRADRKLLQELMTEHAAIVRDGDGLRAAILRILGLVADNAAPDIPVEWALNRLAPATGAPSRPAGAAVSNGPVSGPPDPEGLNGAGASGDPVDGADMPPAQRAGGPDAHTNGAGAQPDSAAVILRELEDSALTLTARALLVAAAARTESRGCHTRSDYPEPREELRRSTSVRLGSDGRPKLVSEGVEPLPWGRAVIPAAS
ncbi:L-aspartate oxidase [Nocardia aurantiaca]|uniref:L-aspartate oxidase n=1 Tax=Nocardia aurantiaca TaxID=2675850 RepID=A0A6I3KZS5_9NOCA|nr:L-aspartate oxidase [Nocardia aurantiaca]MTE13936.1 L-aspartate oxidase [Nocardia aurantiaca]